MVQQLNCPICAGTTRTAIAVKAGFDLRSCEQCEAIFADPMPSDEDLARFYSGFKWGQMGERELQKQQAHNRRGVARFSEDFGRLLGRPVKRVLDFGGGSGTIAAAMAEIFPDVSLFDLDDTARTYARQHFDEHLRIFDNAPEALKVKYDVILVNQVIEHVQDPVTFMRQFAVALEPNGIVVVTTPNNRTTDHFYRPELALHYASLDKDGIASGLRKLFTGKPWLCCDPPRHLFAFNADNLSLAMRTAGYDLLEVRSYFWHEDPFAQPMYVFERLTSIKAAARCAFAAFARTFVRVASAADRRNVNGTNLVGYFRKPGQQH